MSVASVPSPALKKPTPCFKPSSPLRDYHHLLIYLPASSLLPFQFILLTVDKLVFLKHRSGRVTRSKNSSGYLLPSVKQNPLSSAFKGLYGLFIAHYTMVPYALISLAKLVFTVPISCTGCSPCQECIPSSPLPLRISQFPSKLSSKGTCFFPTRLPCIFFVHTSMCTCCFV